MAVMCDAIDRNGRASIGGNNVREGVIAIVWAMTGRVGESHARGGALKSKDIAVKCPSPRRVARAVRGKR